LYAKSAVVTHYWSMAETAGEGIAASFFPVIHVLLMLIAIVMLTAGSAMTKRKKSDREKFETMAIWFSISIILIMLAIPWPFSPLSQRPYIRYF
jgi:cytochrome bd-type quinol oxidase subunit 2